MFYLRIFLNVYVFVSQQIYGFVAGKVSTDALRMHDVSHVIPRLSTGIAASSWSQMLSVSSMKVRESANGSEMISYNVNFIMRISINFRC